MKKFIPKFITSLLFLTILSHIAFGQFEEGTVTSFTIDKIGADIQNQTLDNPYDPGAGEVSKKIKNIITFKINEKSNTFFASSFTATITFTLNTWATLDGPMETHPNQSLQITYNIAEGSKYNVLSYMVFDNLERVEITNPTVTIADETGWDPLPELVLQNQMITTRYFPLANSIDLLQPSFNDPGTDLHDELDVSWDWKPGTNNNLSQLEWAWVDAETQDYYNVDGTINFDNLFKDNSSRVDLDYGQNEYKIPMLYSAGTLYYRVRASYRQNNGNVISGPWSEVQSYAFVDGHEPNLNWQSNTSFAENGKKKSVIQYFDGSLRSRQTVTKDNSTGKVIIGETLYDMQGRASIQILPTPTIKDQIAYTADFNRFQGQVFESEDPAKYFDLTPASVCQGSAPLDTAYGNGIYYSANNPWLHSDEAKSNFIPDAKGYDFTETRFTDDATQRIKSQGGVGETHQIGSGHETKYYYGKPGQQELDALFGTEVGYASHYSKNMVLDPNGQMSVSYVDMHGRTVATALAGDPTSNLDALNTNDYPVASGKLTNQLLTRDNNLVNGNSIVSISSILAPATTIYDFTYRLDPEILHQVNCNNEEICFDCKYDLEISIRSEDCSDDPPIIRKFSNLQIVPADEACGTAMGFTGDDVNTATNEIDFSQTLSTGSWVIRKTLTINDSLFSIRRDSALHAFLCRTRQQIYDSIYNVLALTTNCNSSNQNATACDSCAAHLGDYDTYRSNYLNSVGSNTIITDDMIYSQFQSDSSACASACGISSQLSSLSILRQQMLSDMVPYTGQYAISDYDPSGLEARFNIFSDSYLQNGDPIYGYGEPFFRNPVDEAGNTTYYSTEEKQRDLSISAPGSTLLQTINPDDYTNLFQRSWAAGLIYRHPEFSKLQFAETSLKDEYKWLDDVQQCETYADAVNRGFIDPLNSDPYFIHNYVPQDKLNMQRYLTDHIGNPAHPSTLSIWRIANGSVLCASIPSDYDNLKRECFESYNQTGMEPAATPAQQDQIWAEFKISYLSFRNEMVLRYINSRPGVLSQDDMDLLKGEGKQLRFAGAQDIADQNGWDWWKSVSATSTTGDTSGNADAINTYLINNASTLNPVTNCASQRPFWKAKIMQCEQIMAMINEGNTATVDNIVNSILDGLESVCNNSTNGQHPYGASNVNPTYTGSPQSFEEVINQVFTDYGIQTLPGNNYFCNPFTIDFPKPFGKNPPLMVNYSNVVDSCNCNQFALIKQEAYQQSFDTLDFAAMNQFFLTNYHDSITLIVWEGLQKCSQFYQDTCKNQPPGDPIPDNTAYRKTYSRGGGDCTYPVIDSVTSNHLNNTLAISYSIEQGYANCKLLVYDSSFHQVMNQLLSPDESLIVDSLFLDKTYYFQIVVLSPCGKLFSQVKSYNPGTNVCLKPQISNVTYLTSGEDSGLIQVKYKTSNSNGTYLLSVYDLNNNEVFNDSIQNTDSIVTINELTPCGKYRFVINAYLDVCGNMISDTAYYHGRYSKPVITYVNHYVNHLEDANKFDVHYVISPSYTASTLYCYNENNVEIFNTTLNENDTATAGYPADWLYWRNYKLIIISTDLDCGTIISDTFHYMDKDSCEPVPSINSVHYDDSEKVMKIGFTSTHNQSKLLYVYDDRENFISSLLINANDSSAKVPGLFGCKNYRFLLGNWSTYCPFVTDSAFYFTSDSCCKPEILNAVYKYDGSLMHVTYRVNALDSGCTIHVFDQSNNELINQSLNCTDSVIALEGLDANATYTFQVSSFSDKCDSIFSDKIMYSGSCVAPIINNVEFVGTFGSNDFDVFNVNYTTHTGFDSSSLYVYDSSNTLLNTYSLAGNTNTLQLYGLHRNSNYRFEITSYSQTCSTSSNLYSYGASCESKSIITNVSYNYVTRMFDIKYKTLINNKSSITALEVLDEYDNNGIRLRILNTADSLISIGGLSPCYTHQFVIGNFSFQCLTVSYDSAVYIGTDNCCKSSVTQIQYSGNDSTLNVYYTPISGSADYSIRVYDYQNNLMVIDQELDTSNHLINISGLSPTEKYKFQIVSQSIQCGTAYSDTAYYDGTCPKPEISKIKIIGDFIGPIQTKSYNEAVTAMKIVELTYNIPMSGYESNFYIYDNNNNEIYSNYLDATDNVGYAFIPNSCQNYRVLIKSTSLLCGDILSDTAYLFASDSCCVKPQISGVTYNYEQYSEAQVASVRYHVNLNDSACSLKVYDENNTELYNNNLILTDSLHNVSELDCQKYRFVIDCSSSLCSDLISDTTYSDNDCCPKPVIKAFTYTQQGLLHIDYVPHSIYETCTLLGYDTSYNQVISQPLNCADSSIDISGLSYGQNYYFNIIATSNRCGDITSDTIFYRGADSCAPGVIKNIYYDHSAKQMVISFSQPSGSLSAVEVFDENGNETSQILKNSDSTTRISGLYACKNYKFIIESLSQKCGDIFSDTTAFTATDPCCSPVISSVAFTANENTSQITVPWDPETMTYTPGHEEGNGITPDVIELANPIPADVVRINVLFNVDGTETSLYFLGDNTGSHFGAGFGVTGTSVTVISFSYEVTQQPSFTTTINYQVPPGSDSCYVHAFDTDNNEVINQEIDCSGSSVILNGLNPSNKYAFQIVSHSNPCNGQLSDTAYYDGSCTTPVISKVEYLGSAVEEDQNVDVMQLNYVPHSGYDYCTLSGYDENYNQVVNQSIDCGSSFTYLFELNHCQNYSFTITSHSSFCGDVVSDVFYYNGAQICNPLPVITNARYNYSDSTIKVSYLPLPVSQTCFLLALDSNYNQVINQLINCGDTSVSIHGLDPKQNYYFQIVSNSNATTESFSNMFIYIPAIPSDPCMTYIPIALSDVSVIPPMLACGYLKPCITCDILNQYAAEFRILYPDYAGAPYLDSTAGDDQIQQNALLSRFINYRTGFNKNANEYLLAFSNCANAAGNETALCAFEKPLNDASDYVQEDTSHCTRVATQAEYMSQLLYQNMQDSLIANFDSLYLAKCLQARNNEVFYEKNMPKEYHYTLYFYDQAGNLLKTLPPAAIKPYFDNTFFTNVQDARDAGTDLRNENNNWELATEYRYNTLNQVVVQKTPDANQSSFWYDRLGRLAVSQNARQYPSDFSYTQYDPLGRITEVGEKQSGDAMSQVTSQDETALQNWVSGSGTNHEITGTVYDSRWEPLFDVTNTDVTKNLLFQNNLRNRVSFTYIKETDDPSYLWDAATFYSYDIHGNVDTLLQDFLTGMGSIICPEGSTAKPSGNRFKKMVYQYDLISGKVNTVSYNHGEADQFFHKYTYDLDNKLVQVETSKDSIYWETDATYEYYRHGPLARIELGQNKVQGVDYAYTLQGWLKGINTTGLNAGEFDMGNDGVQSGNHSQVGRDGYGFSLNYFTGDYKPIDADVAPFATVPMGLDPDQATGISMGQQLFNGNIGSMLVNIPKLGETKLYGYRYDQLNRITGMDAFNGFDNTINAFTTAPVRQDDYHENVAYDPNGNIMAYKRNGTTTNLPAGVTGGIDMDALNYEYYTNTNKLKRVRDNTSYSGNYPDDIDDQATEENYVYDLTGNLVRDNTVGEAATITWNVYGKISSIIKDDGTHIDYTYDASGNRISKKVNNKTTYYVRDASGNVMSVYENDVTAGSEIPLTQTELHLYGSSRLGVYNVHVNVQDCNNTPDAITTFIRGNKMFELNNHLGNVLATISDKKIGVDANNDGTVDYFNAEVVTANDYYPFGMMMPGRKYSIANTNYRYGFNGKEKDKDITSGDLDFGARIYDSRLGRWLSRDALAEKYPNASPYNFVLDNPITAIDPDGRLVIFLNGFRPAFPGQNIVREIKRDDKVTKNDKNNYWSGVDQQFKDAIGDHNAVYGDGDAPFLTRGWKPGFKSRVEHGRKAGQDLISKINSGEVVLHKNDKGEVDESIKIVTHSMGYAYSIGVIEELQKAGYKVEVSYNLAPENPKASRIPVGVSRTVQYGSGPTDGILQKDRIAPQDAIPNIDERVTTPDNAGVPKGPYESHNVANFGLWIFNILEGRPGFVAPRKDLHVDRAKVEPEPYKPTGEDIAPLIHF